MGVGVGGYTTTSELFNGHIGVIRIYDKALTAEEVKNKLLILQ